MASRSRRTRVFANTNVLVSGLYSTSGPPVTIIDLHALGQIDLVVSQLVLDELARAVSQKLPSITRRVESFLNETPPEVVPDPSADDAACYLGNINPGDAPIFAAAIQSEIDYFVTGDRRLRNEM